MLAIFNLDWLSYDVHEKIANLYERFEGNIFNTFSANETDVTPDLYRDVMVANDIAPCNTMIVDFSLSGVQAGREAGAGVVAAYIPDHAGNSVALERRSMNFASHIARNPEDIRKIAGKLPDYSAMPQGFSLSKALGRTLN